MDFSFLGGPYATTFPERTREARGERKNSKQRVNVFVLKGRLMISVTINADTEPWHLVLARDRHNDSAKLVIGSP